MAKRIIAAWVEQVIDFDSLEERNRYCDSLTPGTYDIMGGWEYPGFTIRIRKQYNKNNLWKYEDDI